MLAAATGACKRITRATTCRGPEGVTIEIALPQCVETAERDDCSTRARRMFGGVAEARDEDHKITKTGKTACDCATRSVELLQRLRNEGIGCTADWSRWRGHDVECNVPVVHSVIVSADWVVFEQLASPSCRAVLVLWINNHVVSLVVQNRQELF